MTTEENQVIEESISQEGPDPFRMSLSRILLERGSLTPENLEEAERIKEEKGGSIWEIFLRRKMIDETELLTAFGIQYDLPFRPKLPLSPIRMEITEKVPIGFLKKYMMVPLDGRKKEGESADGTEDGAPEYLIALNDPTALQPLDDLLRILDAESCEMVLSTRESILSAINISYDMNRDSAEQLVQDMEEDGTTIISELDGTSDLLDDTSDAPIIRLVNHIISQATKARASDIHFEPYQDTFKVRYRVDGILYDLLTPPKWIQPALVSRIKVMGKLNIAERRLPQDGRLEVKIGDQDIDVRISTLPTAFGERVVLRLLNKSSSLLRLNELGIEKDKLRTLKELVTSPNGIILVTGPTGSGKTTTLYAILSSINTPDINIITIEDPVEYQLYGISQIQVNPKIELTFARGLRSIVRQDPDVILIGEIRDKETAEIAVQSALTGHLVFSTLHTNDSASAITRLVDIGVEPFLISSSVIAVMAQRLIRVLCPDCREAYDPDPEFLKVIGIRPEEIRGRTIYRAKGCDNCFQTGYRGRAVIIEIMPFDSKLKTLVLKTFDSQKILKESGIHTLRKDGIIKVLNGITTIEEILRVTQK